MMIPLSGHQINGIFSYPNQTACSFDDFVCLFTFVYVLTNHQLNSSSLWLIKLFLLCYILSPSFTCRAQLSQLCKSYLNHWLKRERGETWDSPQVGFIHTEHSQMSDPKWTSQVFKSTNNQQIEKPKMAAPSIRSHPFMGFESHRQNSNRIQWSPNHAKDYS